MLLSPRKSNWKGECWTCPLHNLWCSSESSQGMGRRSLWQMPSNAFQQKIPIETPSKAKWCRWPSSYLQRTIGFSGDDNAWQNTQLEPNKVVLVHTLQLMPVARNRRCKTHVATAMGGRGVPDSILDGLGSSVVRRQSNQDLEWCSCPSTGGSHRRKHRSRHVGKWKLQFCKHHSKYEWM